MNVLERIRNLEIHDYNPNISYLGTWGRNGWRTKLNIHKILPFNKEAFRHDKHYFLLWGLNLQFLTLLFYKLIIDLIFFKNCLKDSLSRNLFKMSAKSCFALFCFLVVVLMTPIYYLLYAKK
jgi:hypothetical protein